MKPENLVKQLELLDKLFDYFAEKYGDKRAGIICDKILPAPEGWDLEKMKQIGEKWHKFNIILSGN